MPPDPAANTPSVSSPVYLFLTLQWLGGMYIYYEVVVGTDRVTCTLNLQCLLPSDIIEAPPTGDRNIYRRTASECTYVGRYMWSN